MIFEDIIGQNSQKKVLSRALERDRLAHAYLFHGPDGIGKEAMAIALAKAIICESEKDKPCNQCASCHKMNTLVHPDVTFIFPSPVKLIPDDERKVLDSFVQNPYWRAQLWANPVISIDRVRDIRKTSSFKSNEGHGRVVIIAEVEKMTVPASNALLKILEEPPPNFTLVLTSSKPNTLLPTILSRCQLVRLELLKDEDVEAALVSHQNISKEDARLISRVASGSYRQALELQDKDLDERRDNIVEILRMVILGDYERIKTVEAIQQNNDKKEVKEYLKLLLLWFRDVLLLSHFPDDKNIEEKIVNYDRLEILKKFLGAFEKIDFDMVVVEIENSIKRIDRNIHAGLVLTVLFQQLHTALRRKVNV